MGAIISRYCSCGAVSPASISPQTPADHHPPSPALSVVFAGPFTAPRKGVERSIQVCPELAAVASSNSWLNTAPYKLAGLHVDPTGHLRRPGKELLHPHAASMGTAPLDEQFVPLCGSSATLAEMVATPGVTRNLPRGGDSAYCSDASDSDADVSEHGLDVDTPMFGQGEAFRAALLDGFSSPSIKALHAHGALLLSPASATMNDSHPHRLHVL